MTTLEQDFESWGTYERDNPYLLFAAARDRGPVHRVTLSDGHDAWLIVGYDEARAMLNDTRMSKDMHAALATADDVVAEGLPGPELARHMLVVDPPTTRGSGASCRPRSRCVASSRCVRTSRTQPMSSSTQSPRPDPTARSTSSPRSHSPCPSP